MAETNDTQQRPRLKLWMILVCALVSVPVAVVLEAVTTFGSPGGRLMFYLVPWNGPQPYSLFNFRMSLLVAVAVDSALCFAVLAGVPWLIFTQIAKRK